MPIDRWWGSEPDERLLLEVMDRSYRGADLRAPQAEIRDLVRRHLINEARSERCPVPGLWSECAKGL
jgi:hypothetical protein